MRHTLHSHIIFLENRIQTLRDQLTRAHLTADEVQGIELQISLAELAVARYREAYAIETRVACPDPSDGAGSNFEGGYPPDYPKPDKKKSGLTAFACRVRKKPRARRVSGASARVNQVGFKAR